MISNDAEMISLRRELFEDEEPLDTDQTIE
jgi:hypothetical protein